MGSAMRIISGKHKGRRIEAGKTGNGIRPTSGFARQAIFNILEHSRFGGDAHPFRDRRVADLFCGSGAFGLEALSRGAAHAAFVDKSAASLAATQQNAERFGENARASFIRCDATSLPPAPGPYALVFLDPPYGKGLAAPALASLLRGNWLEPGGLVIVEREAQEKLIPPPGLTLADSRRYGRAAVDWLIFSPN